MGGWSPEQIAGRLKQMHPDEPSERVSHETIYAYIYAQPRGELRKRQMPVYSRGAAGSARLWLRLRQALDPFVYPAHLGEPAELKRFGVVRHRDLDDRIIEHVLRDGKKIAVNPAGRADGGFADSQDDVILREQRAALGGGFLEHRHRERPYSACVGEVRGRAGLPSRQRSQHAGSSSAWASAVPSL